jgi:hypothetical protein
MKLDNVVNLTYSREKRGFVDVTFNDGEIISYSYAQLELPYFYSGVNFLTSGKLKADELALIESCTYEEKEALTDNGYIKMPFYKIVTKVPEEIGRLRSKSSYSAEGNIPYLERRLGADGIVNFTYNVERYAYIDIEEQKAKISLIGVITSLEDKYYPFYNMSSFLEFMEKNKISTIFAWNGNGYDYLRMEKDIPMVEKGKLVTRWNALLKIDAMEIYARYMQKKLMSLNAASAEEELGKKIELSGKFDEIPMKELEVYNEQDVRLLRGIIEKTKIHQIIFRIGSYAGLIPNLISPTRLADNLFIKELQPQGKVLFDYNVRAVGKLEGATIITTKSGVHQKVAGIDLDHLYPSVVMYNSWLGRDMEVWKLVQYFIRKFLEMRAEEKNLYSTTKDDVHDIAQKALKVMSNSWYGVLQNQYYRYANTDMGNFITENARKVREKLQALVELFGFEVILSDTDSVFITNVEEDKAKSMVEIINKKLFPYQVKVEKYFHKMIVMVSNSGKSVKKRYVGIDSKGELKSTGVEIIRSESIPITKEVEKTLFNYLLVENKSEAEIHSYLNSIEERFNSIPIEELLKEKVVDSEKEYKSKTTVVKVAEALNYEIEVSTESFTNKNGVTRDRKKYRITSPNGARLFELRWLLGEKGKPIPVEEGVSLESYSSLVDYDFYWNSAIVQPVNRILLSVGMSMLERKKKPRKRLIKTKEITTKKLEVE